MGIDRCFGARGITVQERTTILNRYKIIKPFIIFIPDEFGDRTDFTSLVNAYACLNSDLRESYQLLIIGNSQKDALAQIISSVRTAALTKNLIIVGSVPNEDLNSLYNLCTLAVFPSFYEFSCLAVLEAMACGAAVIASNSTSFPEIIGRTEGLFDLTHSETIIEVMQRALTDEQFRQTLREHGLAQAKKYSWEKSAQKALTAFKSILEHKLIKSQKSETLPVKKARLAFVSPLPPEKTGISAYSAELLPKLASFYDITLIIDQPKINDLSLAANFPVRNVAWFTANAGTFDRILYQLGNSPFHKHMFALLQRYPGVIVLHDFYLGHLIHWMEVTGYSPKLFSRSLYYSHGYPALSELAQKGYEAAKWDYPCNKLLLDQADGVIVHSQHAVDIARKWYGDNTAKTISLIPQLRSLPEQMGREQAKAELGFQSNDFLICSFGIVNKNKLNHRLLDAWLESSLMQDGQCHLIFVGELEASDYGKEILDKISNSKFKDNIRITGFINSERYNQYLEAADVAVQLRSISRGETSRSVLDALAYGLPVIVNAQGTMAEYPDNILIKLQDDFSDAALISALEKLRKDAEFREQIGMAGKRYVAEFHNPIRISEEYRKAIEHFVLQSQNKRYKALLSSLINIASQVRPNKTDLLLTAESIASNTPQVRQNQLLIDVSILMKHDLGTGIERVTRSVLKKLLDTPPEGYRVEPVYCDKDIFRYARRFTTKVLGIGEIPGFRDDKIEVQQGDIFLGLD